MQIKLDKNIIRTTYNWANKLDENALFDFFLCICAAFKLTDIVETSIVLGSQMKGIEKVIKEKYNRDEYKNIIRNGIVFGEKTSAAIKASMITENVLTQLIPDVIFRKNIEAPDEEIQEDDIDIKNDFNQN